MQHKDIVYLISGFMRCGTSLCTAAMEAGGLKTMYRESRDKMKDSYGDSYYDANPLGLKEMERQDYQELGFPSKYKGYCLKLLMGGLNSMCVMPKIKIVFMRRDAEEIRQSYEAFFDRRMELDNGTFQRKVELIIEQMHNRKDTELIEVWYRDVIENPIKQFQRIKDFGFPIDVEKAVSVVNPELCRFRKEILVEGI